MTVAAVPLDALALPAGSSLRVSLRPALAQVEALLCDAAADAGGVVDTAAAPFAANGVRVAAVLALLGAHRGRGFTAAACTAAVVAELTHLAIGYHTGVPAAPGPSGPERQRHLRAVLAGDLLIVRATGLAAELPRPALRLWAGALTGLYEANLMARPAAAARTLRAVAFRLGAAAAGEHGQLHADALAARDVLERHLSASAAPSARAVP